MKSDQKTASAEKTLKLLCYSKPFYIKPYKEPKIWGVGGIGEYWYGAEDTNKSSMTVFGNDTCPLREIVSYNPESFLGEKVVARFGKQLPLVKILTPKSRLSVQFHDSKNELWIITEIDRSVAGERPWIIIGFSQESANLYGKNVIKHYKKSLLAYGEALNNLINFMINCGNRDLLDTKKDVMSAAIEAVQSRPGSKETAKTLKKLKVARKNLDMFYNMHSVEIGDVVPIPCRTLHALGPGIQVIEPQISGSTQSLEDGATYPVRYAFPAYPRKETERILDIDRAGEMNPNVMRKVFPELIQKTDQVVIERLPGGFEDRGLEVLRLRLEKGAELQQTLTSFHYLAVTHGLASVVINDEKYEIPRALPGGNMLLVPALIGSYTIVAIENTQIIDTYTPV
ncbi:MAG: hypothetical protein MRK02_14090 [Candidatus Scalindua sp.]|nr:hypothetical protein [Candidatus Scalindua sp.]